ncbi:MAG: nucleotide exchange factor GrpE [Lachnospiraceae bacterium]|nr:nucleotide exchange factor GrpE [Lachnospiraceae bacterium]
MAKEPKDMENIEVDEAETKVEETTEEEAQEATENAEETEEAPKKKKKEKKDKKDEQIEELTDRVKRQLAEFENFRNRSEKEKAAMFDMGARTIIEKILPVIDNFERGLASKPDSEEAKAFADGMEMVYKQLLTNLTEAGMEQIEAVDKEFNPDLHNAVMQVEAEDKESGTVAAELQKGYTYHGTVVRHSMVSVVS